MIELVANNLTLLTCLHQCHFWEISGTHSCQGAQPMVALSAARVQGKLRHSSGLVGKGPLPCCGTSV